MLPPKGFITTSHQLSNYLVLGIQYRSKQQQPQQPQVSETTQSQYSNNDLKQMIRDVVRDTVRDVVKEELQKVGMISEGQTTNESLQLRIGSHIFEGKVTKMKKIK